MESSNLADEHTGRHEDNQADDEAELALRHLGDGLSVSEDEDGDREQELDRLQDVDDMARPCAIDSEEGVGVGLHGIPVRVEVEEHFVKLEPRVHGQGAEDCIERDARAIAHLCKSPSARDD